MTMGRPSKVNQPITVTDSDGNERRTTIAAYVHERIEANGLTPAVAGKAAGLSADTVHKWIREGRELQKKVERGLPLFAREQRILDFVRGCDRAHARWVDKMNDLHTTMSKGGLQVVETTLKVDPTRRNDAGDGPLVLERLVKTKILAPDTRAIEWELAHKARAEGFADRLEISGVDGGPIEVDDKAEERRARALLAEIEAYEQGLSDATARQAEQNGATP